jgi:hypothetical protein
VTAASELLNPAGDRFPQNSEFNREFSNILADLLSFWGRTRPFAPQYQNVMEDSLFGAEQGIFRAEQGILEAGTGIRLLDLIPVKFEHLLSSGSWPGLSQPPRLLLLCAVRIRGRRDKPGDDAASDSKRPKSALKSPPAMKRPFRSHPQSKSAVAAVRPDCRTGPCGIGRATGVCRSLFGRGRISCCERSRGFSDLTRWRERLNSEVLPQTGHAAEGQFNFAMIGLFWPTVKKSRFACAFGFTRVPESSGNCAPSQRIAGRADRQLHAGVWLAQ